MEFRLTYAGKLLAHRDDKRLEQRSLHVHEIRQQFHQQLKRLWNEHPILVELKLKPTEWHYRVGAPRTLQVFQDDGFSWQPIVTEANGLICKLDILMLRTGRPGQVLWDIDNRLKTIFDALRKARSPSELGAGTPQGQRTPQPDETPFYVLLEDDRLITHIAVTTDTLLEPVPNLPSDEAARLVIDVTVKPYSPYLETVGYA